MAYFQIVELWLKIKSDEGGGWQNSWQNELIQIEGENL